MKTFVIFRKIFDENGNVTGYEYNHAGYYDAESVDNSNVNRSYLDSEPLATHFECVSGIGSVDIVSPVYDQGVSGWVLEIDDVKVSGVAEMAIEEAERAAIFVEEMRIGYGIKVKAYLGYLCEQADYSPSEYAQLLSDVDLTVIDRLLLNGGLETCKAMIDVYEPNAYFTTNMKSKMSSKLQHYIDLIDAMIG